MFKKRFQQFLKTELKYIVGVFGVYSAWTLGTIIHSLFSKPGLVEAKLRELGLIEVIAEVLENWAFGYLFLFTFLLQGLLLMILIRNVIIWKSINQLGYYLFFSTITVASLFILSLLVFLSFLGIVMLLSG